MNRIVIGCLLVACLIGAISAQAGSSSNTNALAARMAAGGLLNSRSSGLGSMFPLLAIAGGNNDAMLPLLLCRGQMNFMCMMALTQGGIM